jgi:hypothetical protein
MKLIGVKMQNAAEERRMLITRGEQYDRQHARLVKQTGWFAVTRRVIALSVVGALLIWPSFASLFGVPIHFPVESVDSSTSLLFGLFTSNSTTGFIGTKMGFVYFDWQVHLLNAIVGFYFGSTSADRK